jgi:hypothetical protein
MGIWRRPLGNLLQAFLGLMSPPVRHLIIRLLIFLANEQKTHTYQSIRVNNLGHSAGYLQTVQTVPMQMCLVFSVFLSDSDK